MATGHYAGIGAWGRARGARGNSTTNATTTPSDDSDGDRDLHLPFLMQGVDRNKDQSYFLSLTRAEHLQRTLFPLAHLTKEEVRGIAHAAPELRGRSCVSCGRTGRCSHRATHRPTY